MFQWQRETPVQWQTLLDRVCPAGERLSKFRLVWEPGDLQIPVQRWVIWQMRPLHITRHMLWVRRDPRILGLLQEPPRRHARWWESSRSFRKFDGSFAATDRLTYQLYQDTGMFGQRWWVIQGNTGGHRYLLNPTEKKLLGSKADGRFQDVPLAGDLPYAPFDQRVVQHLGEIEQVAIWQRVVQHAEANEARYDADEKFSAEVARSALADWLDRQYAATWDEFKPVYKQALRDMAPTGLSRANIVPADNAQWKEQFVASGT